MEQHEAGPWCPWRSPWEYSGHSADEGAAPVLSYLRSLVSPSPHYPTAGHGFRSDKCLHAISMHYPCDWKSPNKMSCDNTMQEQTKRLTQQARGSRKTRDPCHSFTLKLISYLTAMNRSQLETPSTYFKAPVLTKCDTQLAMTSPPPRAPLHPKSEYFSEIQTALGRSSSQETPASETQRRLCWLTTPGTKLLFKLFVLPTAIKEDGAELQEKRVQKAHVWSCTAAHHLAQTPTAMEVQLMQEHST